MKKLLLICGLVFSMTAIFAQAKTETNTTTETAQVTTSETDEKVKFVPTYKNAISTSFLFVKGDMGISFDYRRRFGSKDELVLGFDRTINGNKTVNFGYRRYFIQKEKFGMSIGLNTRLSNIYIQEGGLGLGFTGFPRVQRATLQGVIGGYYKANEKLEIMFETRLVPVFSVLGRNNNHISRLGVKYMF